nr:hypothetical protein JVH1_4534 [Rhodococcus sp. JVH1]
MAPVPLSPCQRCAWWYAVVAQPGHKVSSVKAQPLICAAPAAAVRSPVPVRNP